MRLLANKRARVAVLLALVALALILPITVIVANRLLPINPGRFGENLIQKRSFPSLSYGIQAFLWWNAFTRVRDLENVRMMRFGYVKQTVYWDDIQPDTASVPNWQHMDDVVNETAYRQLKLIARIDQAPYWAINPSSDGNTLPFDLKALGDFCHNVASRYKGKIAGYQVWNEPNLAREWNNQPPSPAGYVKLLAACYAGIKSADPNAIVISAPLAPTGNDDQTAMPDTKYLQAMFDAGLSAYYDVLGLNAPGYKSPPETAPDDPALQGNRWQAFRHVEDMRDLQVAHGDGARQIALLEVGWTTDARDKIMQDGKLVDNPYRWHAVTEIEQAQYLLHAYLYAGQHWRPWIGLMVTIYLPDPTWTPDNEEYWWSIADTGNTPRLHEAFFTLANSARYIDDTFTPAIDPYYNPYKPLPPASPTPINTPATASIP